MASGSNWFRQTRKRPHSSSDPPEPSTNNNPGSSGGKNSTSNDAIKTLKSALGILQGGLNVFPPLKSAMDELVECTTHLQIADRNSDEYQRLAADLATLAYSLQARLPESKPMRTPFSVQNVARAITEQARHIQLHRDRSRTRRFAAAREDENDILGCYRRVVALFEQLQVDISLCIWDVVREQQMNTYLRDLLPADDAYYNSALPAAMTKRRTCTKNTRTQVISEAQSWTRGEGSVKIYWMNGMAGTGKTTIACSLCKWLEDNKQLGASFFCSRDSPTCRDVSKIIPTIAYQLGQYSLPYRQALCEVLSNDPNVAKKDIETQFDSLIAKPLGGIKAAMPGDVVVVIDALDECADITGTKQVLELLFRHAQDIPLKFFVASRPEPGIADKIIPRDDASRSILRLHDIEKSLVQDDIKTYLIEALSPTQLTLNEIDQLSVRAGSLFIFAATAVRYILPETGLVNDRQRLATLLGLDPNPDPSNKSSRDIDRLYMAILRSAFDTELLEDHEVNTRQLVLRTVVCAREPLTMSAITELLGLTDDQDVQLAVRPLQSVLHLSDSTGVVSTLHASFPDFLLSEKRAQSLYCDEAKHNDYLATGCFGLMKRSLRFNICQLETSSRFDREVPDLQTRVEQAISVGLCYACRYWGDHLLSAAMPNMLAAHFDGFLQHRLLFWMEALNLKHWIGHAENMLSQALSWLPPDEASTALRQFTSDARNFVTTFAANPTSLSTPHIYLSVLPFTSTQNHVRMIYWPRTRGLLRVEGTGMESRGKAALATWNVRSEVMSMAQSGDGKHIVSGSSDGTVSVWDVSNGARIVGPLRCGQGGGWSWLDPSYGPCVAFSFDGKHIASGSQDHSIHIWHAQSGQLITGPLSGHSGPVLSVAFSPDEMLLASASEDCTIRIWTRGSGALASRTLEGHRSFVTCVAFSSDSKKLASCSTDQTIRIWDVHTGTTIVGPFEGHSGWVQSVAFSRDGQRVVSGSSDATIRVWDAHSGTMIVGPLSGHTYWIQSVTFSPNGMQVVSGSRDHTICIWDSENGALLAGPLEGHRAPVNSVLFTVDGSRIHSGSEDGTICVWDARHGTTAAAKSLGHIKAIYSVAFSPDGTRAVSGSSDRTIRVWDTRDGRLVIGPLEGHTGDVLSVAFSPDGARIVSGSGDRTLRTWDARTGTLISSFKGHTWGVRSVAFSPDGSLIASASGDRTIRVWDSQTGELAVDPLEGHTNFVQSVAFSPDGRIVSGCWDGTVRMWNVLEGTAPIWTSDAHTGNVLCMAISPDGTRVVSGFNDGTIVVLNALDGTVLLGPFKRHTARVLSVAFSPDGTRIVSGSWDRTVCVWNARNGALVSSPFKGHTDDVHSVAFSPDGRRVVSGSDDRTIRFWDIPAPHTSNPSYLDRCTLRDDGWVTHSDSQLLVWVPPDLRNGFPLPPLSLEISEQRTVGADYSNFLVGERWHECYQPPSITPP